MKLFNKIGDHLFNLTEKYFEGKQLNEEFPVASDPVDGHCIVWTLDQGVEDIIINDLKGSFRFLLPLNVQHRVLDLYKRACLFFLVDAIIEDETIDPDYVRENLLTYSDSMAEKQITLDPEAKKSKIVRIISLQDWFKTKIRIVHNYIRRLRKDNKPYYLLGDFTPYTPEFKIATDCHQDNINLTRTYLFNKRN